MATEPSECSDVGVDREDDFPTQTPLYYSEHSDRYDRQHLIQQYEKWFDCRLVVLIDGIFPESITYFEELVFDASSQQAMHMLLSSPGGDGETAVRLIRSAQARCSELTVVVPTQAKSAATVIALGSHKILKGPTSDLGPVDPLLHFESHGLVSAKDIIATLDRAEKAVIRNPVTFPLIP